MSVTFHDDSGDTVLKYYEDIFSPDKYHIITQFMKEQNYCKGYSTGGKEISREQLWFHESSQYFCYEWKKRFPRWEGNAYTDTLTQIQSWVQEIVDSTCDTEPSIQRPNLNSCLMNRYADGTCFITSHRDNSKSFGLDPTIIGISTGATRKIVLRHNFKPLEHTIDLKDNSIFIMAGASQRNWMHEVIPDPDCDKERYSMTFREHLRMGTLVT